MTNTKKARLALSKIEEARKLLIEIEESITQENITNARRLLSGVIGNLKTLKL